MKKSLKKYPLLISLIVSCAIVVASIFVLAFCGLKLSPSLGGGSQFEIAISDSADTKTYYQHIRRVVASKGYSVDSCTVEDKYLESGNSGEFTKRYIIINVSASDISDEKETEIRNAIAEDLSISVNNISSISNIVSSIKSKDILLFGLGIGIIAVCLFIFGFVRYDIFAGLSFLLSMLHSLILFLSIMILTRIPLSLVSIASISILSLVMSAVLISIFERNKIETALHSADKEMPTAKMIRSEISAIKPYSFVAIATLLFAVVLFVVPVTNVVFSALSIIVALVVSAYTAILIGPAVYSSFLDIKYTAMQATLSRNDTVNKVIKKKIAKANKSSK